MKEPRRLLADTRDPFQQEVLRAWKRAAPDNAAREHAWAEVAPAVGLAAGALATAAHAGAKAVVTANATPALTAAVAPSTAVAGTATTWAAASLVKWIVIASVASGAAATALVVRAPAARAPLDRASTGLAAPPARVASSALAPSPLAPSPLAGAAPPTPAAPVLAEIPVAAPSTRRVVPAAPASAPTGAADEHLVARQVASLDEARGALGAGDAARALRLLDDFDARFPGGELSEEAAVLRVKALLAAGRRGDAMAAGKHFVDEHPSSPYSTRIRGLIEAR